MATHEDELSRQEHLFRQIPPFEVAVRLDGVCAEFVRGRSGNFCEGGGPYSSPKDLPDLPSGKRGLLHRSMESAGKIGKVAKEGVAKSGDDQGSKQPDRIAVGGEAEKEGMVR